MYQTIKGTQKAGSQYNFLLAEHLPREYYQSKLLQTKLAEKYETAKNIK